MKKLIVGNWKMNGSQALLEQFYRDNVLAESSNAEIVICPPTLFIKDALSSAKHFSIGAQDCSNMQSGAYTGDVSADMLAIAGVTHVIVGHSERRRYQRETNDKCAGKVKSVQAAGIIPIFCIGETKADYDSRLTFDVLANQLESLKVHNVDFQNLVIAYEPIWAIGTGLVPDEKTIDNVMIQIKKWIIENVDIQADSEIHFLYGGSVTPDNSQSILELPSVDGLLIGGASLDAAKFSKIAQSACHLVSSS